MFTGIVLSICQHNRVSKCSHTLSFLHSLDITLLAINIVCVFLFITMYLYCVNINRLAKLI